MTSVQMYLQIVHDKSTPSWVISLLCRVIDMDVCEASAGIDAVKELLDLKLEETAFKQQYNIEGHDNHWEDSSYV